MAAASLRRELRRATPADAAVVATWIRSASELRWLAPDVDYPLSPATVTGWGIGSGRRAFVLPGPVGDMPMGYAELNDMPEGGGRLWLGHAIVAPEHRGQRIGRTMVSRLIDKAFEELNTREIILVVVPENTAAIRCYTASGFVATGEEWKVHPRTGERYRLIRMLAVGQSANRDWA